MRILAQAPSNIAIVKYMGKSDTALNLPAQPSVSMTLNSLRTFVELRRVESNRMNLVWVGDESLQGFASPKISSAGIEKFTRHLDRMWNELPGVLRRWDLRVESAPAQIEIRSANTFPEASGIASSASSFAALTLAAAAMISGDQLETFEKIYSQENELRRALARLSRRGSGSSCRSFEGPWVRWEAESATAVESRLPELSDLIVLTGEGMKEVSSSEAHRRVTESPLWSGRVERATQREREASQAIGDGNWKTMVRIAWEELWEMHSLFHTSQQPFTYWNPMSVEILKWIRPHVERAECLVTMDAGPHVHILVPQSESERWKNLLKEKFPTQKILLDKSSPGASFV